MGSIRLNGSAPAPLAVGQDLLGAMLDAGQPAMYLCMGGSCGRCRARILTGGDALTPVNQAEIHHRCSPDVRLTCQARLAGEAAVSVRQPS